MLTQQEQTAIIDFYSQLRQQMTTADSWDFYMDLDKLVAYVMLGNEHENDYFSLDRKYIYAQGNELYIGRQEPPDDDWEYTYKVAELPEAVRIKRPNPKVVPASIIEAFNRQLWYSRYALTYVSLLSLDVAGCQTFAFHIEGNVDGTWDNSIYAWEVYEANGDLICSLIESGFDWLCKETAIMPEDFEEFIEPPPFPPPYTAEMIARSPSPIWLESHGFWVLPFWSEEEVTIVGQQTQ